MWSDGPCGTGLREDGGIDGGMTDAAPGRLRRQPGRLVGWIALTGALAALSYASRAAGGEPPQDVLYLWSTFVGALVQYGIMLGLILAIAHGFDRDLLALNVPERKLRAVGRMAIALGVILAAAGILSRFLDAGDEQGLVPHSWDSSRALPFLANAAVVVLAAPLVEELLYRGLGISLLEPYVGAWAAIVVTGVAFGLAHGLVLGLPVLSIFGITLGWLRRQTGSVVPGMVVHGLFNGMALLAAVLS
jgi:membrane protease YdiL (CAAX protease family)